MHIRLQPSVCRWLDRSKDPSRDILRSFHNRTLHHLRRHRFHTCGSLPTVVRKKINHDQISWRYWASRISSGCKIDKDAIEWVHLWVPRWICRPPLVLSSTKYTTPADCNRSVRKKVNKREGRKKKRKKLLKAQNRTAPCWNVLWDFSSSFCRSFSCLTLPGYRSRQGIVDNSRCYSICLFLFSFWLSLSLFLLTVHTQQQSKERERKKGNNVEVSGVFFIYLFFFRFIYFPLFFYLSCLLLFFIFVPASQRQS